MRVKSGVTGLNDLIDGGFPSGTVNLICGPAGSAKSLFAMQFLCEEGREKCALITLEESRENVLRASAGYGLPLGELEEKGVLTILDMGAVRAASGDNEDAERELVDFKSLLEIARQLRKEGGITRLVVDSLSAVGLYYTSAEAYRRELFKFCRGLKSSGVTSLLIAEASPQGFTTTGVEQFVADSMIQLGYENVKGEYRRTLTVYKMRFTRHDPYKHPFLITPSGIEVDPDEVIF
jgi:KaiC/GvpD/RAD55 family RecA-like ATPase